MLIELAHTNVRVLCSERVVLNVGCHDNPNRITLTQETSEQMVTRSMKACPNLLSQQSQKQLRGLVMHEQDRDYQYVKKAVAKKTAPEIINHISAINLDTAANISELLVEQTLAKLDQANHKLVSNHWYHSLYEYR